MNAGMIWSPEGDFKKLQTAIAAADEINFSNIPTGWKFFYIQGMIGSNAGNAVYLQFNGDTGAAAYTANRQDDSGGSVTHTNQGNTATPYLGITSAGSNMGNIFTIMQPAYASLPKLVSAWCFGAANMRIASGQWNNTTDEINAIKIKPTGGTMTGKLTLYGWKV